jgi:hypothetical protein
MQEKEEEEWLAMLGAPFLPFDTEDIPVDP